MVWDIIKQNFRGVFRQSIARGHIIPLDGTGKEW